LGAVKGTDKVKPIAIGATVVLYDGSPFHPSPEALWEMAEEIGITVFGTSARYLAAIEEAGVKPGEHPQDLSPLPLLLRRRPTKLTAQIHLQ